MDAEFLFLKTICSLNFLLNDTRFCAWTRKNEGLSVLHLIRIGQKKCGSIILGNYPPTPPLS